MRPAQVGRSGKLRLARRMCHSGMTYASLSVAREWLGLPFETSALPQIDGLLRKGDSLYVDSQRLLSSWPCPVYDPYEHDIFAQPFKISFEQGTWVMKGEVWDIRQGQNDALDVSVCETFRLVVKKTGKLWRIFSLDFGV